MHQNYGLWHSSHGHAERNVLMGMLSEPECEISPTRLVSEQEIGEKLDRLGLYLDPEWISCIVSEIHCTVAERLTFPGTSWMVGARFKRRMLFWQTWFIEIYPVDVDDTDFGVITQIGDAAVLIDERYWRVISQIGDQITKRICLEQDIALTVIGAMDPPATLRLWTTGMLDGVKDVASTRHEENTRVKDAIAALIEHRLTSHVTPLYAASAVCEQLFQNRVAGHAVAQVIATSGNNVPGDWLEMMAASAAGLIDAPSEDVSLFPLLAVLAGATNTSNLSLLKKKLGIHQKTFHRLRHLSPMTLVHLAEACPRTHGECAHYMGALAEVLATVDSLSKNLQCREGNVSLDVEMPLALRALARIESLRDDGFHMLDYDYVAALTCFTDISLEEVLPPFSSQETPELPVSSEQVIALLRSYIRALAEGEHDALEIRIDAAWDWMIDQGAVIDLNKKRTGWPFVAKRVRAWHLELAATDATDTLLSTPPWRCKLTEVPESTWWHKIIPVGSPYAIRPLVTAAALQEEGKMMEHCVLSRAPMCAQGRARIFSVYEIDSGCRVATVELGRSTRDGLWELREMKGFQNSKIAHVMAIPGKPLLEIVTRLLGWHNNFSA